MKHYFVLTVLCLLFIISNSQAHANVFGDGGNGLQRVFNYITIDGNSTVNAASDMIDDNLDSYWSISSADGAAATIIVQIAHFAPQSSFGIFDAYDPNNTVEIFRGSSPFQSQAALNIKQNGEVWLNHFNTGIVFSGNLFGYYLDSSHHSYGGFWYSDASLNSDEMDHLYAYQGINTDFVKLPGNEPGLWTDSDFILAFEDLKASAPSDRDYIDFVVMVESVHPKHFPFPIPATQEYYPYAPVTNSALSASPAEAKPFSVGNIDCGILNLHFKSLPFSSPVDIYLGIYAPRLSSELFLINPDNSIQPFSTVLTKWKQSITGPVDESLYGNIPIESLTPGIYYLYTMVTPADNLDAYYLWETYFEIP